MVIGFNSDNPDDFAIVLLAPLGDGQTISATDDGWLTDSSAFRGTETHATHTAAIEEPPGTVFTNSAFTVMGSRSEIQQISSSCIEVSRRVPHFCARSITRAE
jgi:hypothetical protein